jgi:hypothetical protein
MRLREVVRNAVHEDYCAKLKRKLPVERKLKEN